MKPKLILGLVSVMAVTLVGCLSTTNSANQETAPSLQNLLQKIEQKIPELESVDMTIPPSWHGEECVSTGFVLRKNTRFHPIGDFQRETSPVPYIDVFATIARYGSSSDAQNDLEKSLRMRPAAFPPRAIYKGAVLHKYEGASGKPSTAICQSGLYIVEINANSEGASPFIMKAMDVMLARIDSTSSKSK